MRVFVSFFLSLLIYCLILIFLYVTFFYHKEKKEVLIHTAIIIPQTKHIKSVVNKVKNFKKTSKSKAKKIKKGSKSSVTKSGTVDFKDIFENVNYNVPTKKVLLKKEDSLSRFKSKISQRLKNIKNINVNISFSTTSNVTKEKVNELVKKISEIWDEISDIAGEYATIKFIISNKEVFVYLLDTNLNENKQQLLVEKLKNIKFDQDINLKIKLQTKVSK